jgi:hypothetical protein
MSTIGQVTAKGDATIATWRKKRATRWSTNYVEAGQQPRTLTSSLPTSKTEGKCRELGDFRVTHKVAIDRGSF